MGTIQSLFKKKTIIKSLKNKYSNDEIIEFLQDLYEQLIYENRDRPSLTLRYKLEHLRTLILIYKKD